MVNYPDLSLFEPIFNNYVKGNAGKLKPYEIMKYVGVHLAGLKLLMSLNLLRNISCDQFQIPDYAKRFSLFKWNYDDYRCNRTLDIAWLSKYFKQYSIDNLKSYKYMVDMQELENLIAAIYNTFIYQKSFNTINEQLNNMKSFEKYYGKFKRQRMSIYEDYLESFTEALQGVQYKITRERKKQQSIDFVTINYYKSMYECKFEHEALNQRMIGFQLAEKKLIGEIEHYQLLIRRETICLKQILRAYLKENDAIIELLENFEHEYSSKRESVVNQQRLLKRKAESLQAVWHLKIEEMDFFQTEINEYFRRVTLHAISNPSSKDGKSDPSPSSRSRKLNKNKNIKNKKRKLFKI